jgi:hypothetical protein
MLAGLKEFAQKGSSSLRDTVLILSSRLMVKRRVGGEREREEERTIEREREMTGRQTDTNTYNHTNIQTYKQPILPDPSG